LLGPKTTNGTYAYCTNCTLLSGTPCDDMNPCTVNDTCLIGVCMNGTAKNCTQILGKNVTQCRSPYCENTTGICKLDMHFYDNRTCNDGNNCTVDACRNGTCVGTFTRQQALLYPKLCIVPVTPIASASTGLIAGLIAAGLAVLLLLLLGLAFLLKNIGGKPVKPGGSGADTMGGAQNNPIHEPANQSTNNPIFEQ